MSIHDRDYYRDEIAKKTGSARPTQQRANSTLDNIVNQTEKRRGLSRPIIALIWVCVVAALYGVFTLTKR